MHLTFAILGLVFALVGLPSSIVFIIKLVKLKRVKFQEEELVSQKKKTAKWITLLIIAITVTTVAVLILIVVLFQPRFPQLKGLTVKEASATLRDHELEMVIVDSMWSDTIHKIPEGCIITQEPGPGAIIERKRIVKVWISKGIQTPDFKGMELDSAIQALSAFDALPKIESTYTDEVAKGQVLRTNPPAKAKLPVGDTVIVIISAGRKTCPKCHRQVDPQWRFCEYDSTEINP